MTLLSKAELKLTRSTNITIRRHLRKIRKLISRPEPRIGPKITADIWVNLRTTRKTRQLDTVSTSSGKLQKKIPLRRQRRRDPRRSTKRESKTLQKPSTSIPSGMFRSLSNNLLRLKHQRMENLMLMTVLIKILLGPMTKMIIQTRILSKKKPRSSQVVPITHSLKEDTEKNCEREMMRIQMLNVDLIALGLIIKKLT